ncbi:MAG: DUF1302 domain-containing protein [Burkholderiales bacterium]
MSQRATHYRAGAVAIAAALCCAAAHAGNFETDDGLKGRWSLGASLGTSIRTASPDQNLVAVGNGGTAGIGNDNGDLNFKKNHPYSTALNVVGDIDLSKNNFGFFARAKGWYDYTLSNKSVPHGSAANGYVPNTKLNDDSFDRLSRFSGVALLDAYARAEFDLPTKQKMSVRLGNQVVNWGESLFVPGVNSYAAFDVTAAHRPGAQLKEIFLPIPQVFASVALSDAVSVEGFYQLANRRHVLDGCGTFWSASSIVNCSTSTTVGSGPLTDQEMLSGSPALGGANLAMSVVERKTSSSRGQFGLAGRFRAAAIDTDFGLYYTQYNTRAPNISSLFAATTIPGSLWAGGIAPRTAVYDFSADKIKVAGLSASTLIGSWSVFGEISHSSNVPVQISGVDLLNGAVGGIGPMGSLGPGGTPTPTLPAGSYVQGYDRKSKTQAQISTIQLFSRVLGAESLIFVGEVAGQYWNDMSGPNGRRYGRAFVFGSGPVPAFGVDLCSANLGPGTGTPLNSNTSYCNNQGFFTSTAWGYRMLFEASYSDVFAGVNLKPRLFLSHDVKGYSADSVFSQGRITVSPGVRFDYRSKYYVDVSYARFARAKYDEMHDRDFVSLVAGINF